jgi:hypothetical protein
MLHGAKIWAERTQIQTSKPEGPSPEVGEMNCVTMGVKTKTNKEQRKGERADAELQHCVVGRCSRQLVDRGEGAPGVGGGGLGV